MEKVKKSFILLLGMSLPLILLLHCSKYKEPAPFFDGLFLKYDAMGGTYVYEVSVLENNRFKIIKTEKWSALRPKPIVMIVDAYGIVYTSSKKRYEGRFSPIWISVHEMKIGDTFDGRKLVERKDKWEKWEVLVVKDTPTGGERYYDLSTGYWVGSFARTPKGAGKIVLVNTNANIPTVEE